MSMKITEEKVKNADIPETISYNYNNGTLKMYFNVFAPYEVMITNTDKPIFFTKGDTEKIFEFLTHLYCEGWIEKL